MADRDQAFDLVGMAFDLRNSQSFSTHMNYLWPRLNADSDQVGLDWS